MTSISSKDQALAGQTEALPALLAGAVSAALLLGAFAFQYLGGLAPCEMCIWQRWPHGAAILFGLVGGGLVAARVVPASLARTLAVLAILALAISGAIGIFHAGVERLESSTPASSGSFGPVRPNAPGSVTCRAATISSRCRSCVAMRRNGGCLASRSRDTMRSSLWELRSSCCPCCGGRRHSQAQWVFGPRQSCGDRARCSRGRRNLFFRKSTP